MGKAIRNVFKTETLSLTECTDGYYLYDTTRGMNIVMYSKTEQSALIEGLIYYQKRLKEVETSHKLLTDKVDSFLCQFNLDDL